MKWSEIVRNSLGQWRGSLFWKYVWRWELYCV